MVNTVKDETINGIRIAVFVETLINIIFSKPEKTYDRVYFILDELGAAARMEKLISLLQLGRSFNCSVLIGIQEISRFDAVYGADTRKTIINNTATKILLRADEADTNEINSKMIGEYEREVFAKSSSMGIESNRDGQGVNSSIKKERAVLPSQFNQLKDLEYYINQPDQNWTHIQTEFIPKIDLHKDIHESEVLCDSLKGFSAKQKSDDEIEEAKEEDETPIPKTSSTTFG